MANFQGKDAGASTIDFAADGAGTVGDPHVPHTKVQQDTHDSLNLNANIQVGDADVGAGNPVPISDNSGSITVDGTVATELTTDDLDTGAGTDTRAVVGMVLAEAAGGALVGSANPMPVSGTVTADAGTGPWPVTDNSGSLTVDNATHDNFNANANMQIGDADVGAGNPVPISDNGGALTVDGTVTADAGTGPWPVTDNGGSLTVDGTVDTELTTDDLNTGAGTDTRAVVGMVLAEATGGALVGSANPMPISDNGGALTVDQATHDSLNLNANIQVGDADVGAGNPVPISDNSGSITVDNAALAVVGGGAEATALRVTLANDSTGLVSVDDGAGSLTVDGTVTADAGTGPWPVTDNSGSLTVDQATHDNFNVNANAQVGDADVSTSNPIPVRQIPGTADGLSIMRSLDLDETEEAVKASAGQLFGWFIYNLASAKRYIKFYNATVATVVVGTTTPVLTIPLEADQAANVEFNNGIEFSTAITVAATTGLADNDTGAPGANEVVVNIFYK